MSDLQADLLKILVEKGLLALILAYLAFYVQRALERYRAQNVYYQKLAEEKLAGLKDISLIYSQQLVLLGQFARILQRTRPDTPEARNKLGNDLSAAYEAFAQHYREQAAILLRNTMFASRELADLMIKHQKRVGRIVEVLDDVDKYVNDPNAEPVLSLNESLAELQHAIATEVRNPPAP